MNTAAADVSASVKVGQRAAVFAHVDKPPKKPLRSWLICAGEVRLPCFQRDDTLFLNPFSDGA